MVSLIFAQVESGITIPGWALGLISLGFVLAILPWGSWVTYTIFTLKSDVNLETNNTKTIFEKIATLSTTIDRNHQETKKDMKDLKEELNKSIRQELRRFRGREEDEDEKDE